MPKGIYKHRNNIINNTGGFRPGRNQSEYCTRGHLMEETRRRHRNGDSYCVACSRIRTKEFKNNNPEKIKRYQKKSKIKQAYNITLEEIENLFIEQDKKCAICNKKIQINSKDFQVDHCHKTDKVRGILCMKCNLALGFLKDDIEILALAIKYLSKKKK